MMEKILVMLLLIGLVGVVVFGGDYGHPSEPIFIDEEPIELPDDYYMSSPAGGF